MEMMPSHFGSGFIKKAAQGSMILIAFQLNAQFCSYKFCILCMVNESVSYKRIKL